MNRNIAIDVAKGICIALMISGHCPGFAPIYYNGIESFHMPLFFIASGLFYRQKEFSTLLKDNFRRLIIPMWVGVVVCALVCFLMKNEESAIDYIKGLLYPGGTRRKDILIQGWPSTGVYWFLAALFWCKIIYNQLEKYCSKYVLLISFALSWIIGTMAHRIMLPLGISEGCSALIFYAIGHQATKMNVPEKRVPIWSYPLFIVLWLIEIHFVEFGMYECSWSPWVFPPAVLFASGMSYLVYNLSDMIKTNMVGKIFSAIGLYSLEVMCCHEVIRAMVRNFQKLRVLDDNVYMVMMAIFTGTLILSSLYIVSKLYVKKKISKI